MMSQDKFEACLPETFEEVDDLAPRMPEYISNTRFSQSHPDALSHGLHISLPLN